MATAATIIASSTRSTTSPVRKTDGTATPSRTSDGATTSNKVKVRETCPSFARANFTSPDKIQNYRFLSEPHVESFNYFLTVGLQKAVLDIDATEMDLVDWKQQQASANNDLSTATATSTSSNTVETIKFWFENIKIQPPSKQGFGGSQHLYPRECRELGIMYSGS